MTTEQKKEETRKKFNEAYNAEIVRLAEFDLGTDSLMDFIFDFFYSEIEARDADIDFQKRHRELNSKALIIVERELENHKSKLKRLEELNKAADEVIDQIKFEPHLSGSTVAARHGYKLFVETLAAYNKLKSKT